MEKITTNFIKNRLYRRACSVFVLFLLLTGDLAFGQGYVTLGTQGSQSGNTTTSPVSGYFNSRRIQIVYTAAELNAGGAAAGNIERLAWDVSVAYGDPGGLPNYTVKMAHITTPDIPTTTFITPLTTVKNPYSYIPATGFNDITFDTPFNWNGTDNILVDICFNNAPYLGFSSTLHGQCWNYTGVSNNYRARQVDGSDLCGNETANQTQSAKPRVRFFMQQQPPCAGTPEGGAITGALQRFICSGSAPGAIAVTGASSPVVSGISLQWEESINGGTDWANATGGTGATTATYTPPSFAGTAIQYRLKATCANGGGIDYSDVLTVSPQTAPATQASAIMTTNLGSNAFTVTWTNGDGARRHVLVSTDPIVDPVSANGVAAYTAAAAFANTGQQIVFDGTGSSVTVTGLTCNTTYYVKVYEYTRCGSGPYDVYFNTTTGTNAITVTGPLTAGVLPIVNDFTDFTGDNLGTAVPGWYESSITTAAGTEPVSVNPVGVGSDWTSSTNLGGVKTAKINLFTNTRNSWIISPKIALTSNSRLKFKAAITNFGSAAADAAGMQGTDDKVKVMVTTDCGATWTTLYTFQASNTTTLTNALTDYTLQLSAFTGQTVQLAFQATDGPVNDDPDYDFHITNILVEELPACDVPVVNAPDAITKNSVTISWTASTVGVPTAYEYAVITTDTAPVSGTETTETSVDVMGLLPSTTYYVFVRTECTDVFSDWSLVETFTTLCDYPDILSTTPDSVCGQGEATLEAEAESGSLYWYADAEGGAYLATDETFTTPLITETTSFYVSSGISLPDSVVPVGEGATTSNTYSNPFYSLWSNNHTQHLITAAELQAAGLSAGDITSVALDVTSAGSLPMIDLSVKIGTTTATSMEAFVAADDLDVVYTSESYMPTAGVNTLTFTTPFNWDGTSNIVLEFCHGNEDSGATMSRTVKADNTSYVSSVKRHFSSGTSADEVCSATTGGTLASYSVRPQFIFNGVGICFSPRVEVVATVTDAPDVTVVVTEDTICNGESTDLSVTSANANYTYVWMPGNLSGALQTVSPTETTTYTVTATDADTGCVEVGEITVTVNPLPVITEDLTDMEVCEGGVMPLTFGVENAAMAAFGSGESNSVAQTTGTTLGPNPLQNYYGGAKQQWIYTAAELTAMGMIAGSEINSIALNLNTANPDLDLEGLEIKMKNTTQASFATTTSWIADMTVVMPAVDYAPVVGLNTFTLATPFVWDGESNLAIQMRFSNDNAPSEGTNSAKFSPTAFTSTIFYRADNLEPLEMEAYTGTATATYSQRNDVTFIFNQPLEVEWSPITNLYTDEAATTPYTGEPAAVVYTKPVADITYSATATSLDGCSVTSAAANITINITPAPTADETTQPFCNSATVADLEATGEMVKWYYSAMGGTAIATTTQLLDGTVYYASQTVDGCESMARTAVTVEINVTPAPVVEEDVLTICNEGTVADLMDAATGTDVQWYTEIMGGEALTAETALEEGVSLYYASQTVDGCESAMRTPLVVVVNVVEAPMADAEQSFCNEGTVADLMPNGTDIMWYADETATEPLTGDTVLVDGTTYYASQMIDGCESMDRTAVMATINTTAAPTADAEQFFCAEGFVSGLMADGDNVMWYADETSTEPLTGDTVLTDGTTYYASQTVDGCESTLRTAVMVTVNVTPAPEGESMQTIEAETAADATIEDLVVTTVEGGTVMWYATMEDAMNNTNPIAPGTQLVSEETYYAVQFVDDCASMPFEVTVTVALDVRDFDSANFTYHPNPVRDVLTIAYSSNITSVTVYNMLGQPVISQDVNALEGNINMANLADGTYIVNVTVGNASKTIKVIKKQ